MQIQVNTDKSIDHTAALDTHVEEVLQSAIGRFGEQISRVEVHLSDNKAQKSADGDNRCMMEARVNGYQPVVVTDHADTLHQAIHRSADKLKRALDSALGKLHDNKKNVPVADLVEPSVEPAEE